MAEPLAESLAETNARFQRAFTASTKAFFYVETRLKNRKGINANHVANKAAWREFRRVWRKDLKQV